MRMLICADVEGASGVGLESMLSDDEFQQVRELITGDVNACAKGIRQASPNAQIDLFDAHGLGGNVIEEDLEEGVALLGGGWVDTLFPLASSGRLREYDGLFLVGQHAANGTKNGFISHTNSSFTALRVNGCDAGEAEQLAWLAGAHGVPTLLVVGDDATEREVRALLPGVHTVVVKRAIDRKTAECRPVDEVWREIEAASAKATADAANTPPSTVDEPVAIELFFAHPDASSLVKPFRDISIGEDGAVRFEREDYVDAWFHYQTMARVAPQYLLYQQCYRGLREAFDGSREVIEKVCEDFNALCESDDSLIPDVRYSGTSAS